MRELDHWLEGHTGYLFLQRMGLMAPLIGLLITVSGFLLFTLPEGEIVGQVIHALSPLVLGTGVGASLALINNLLLHVAGKQTETLRSTAASWLDDCSSASRKTVEDKPVRELADALLEMRAIIGESVGQYRKAATAMAQTSQSLRDSARATISATQELNADLHAFSDEMKSSRRRAAATLRSMNDVGPNLDRLTSAWAESAAALKSVIQVPFAQAAQQHQQAVDLFARFVQQIGGSATQLNNKVSLFAGSIDQQVRVVQKWSSSLDEDVLPAQREFRQLGARLHKAADGLVPVAPAFQNLIDSMSSSSATLSAFVQEGLEPATRRLVELNGLLATTKETAEMASQIAALRDDFTDLKDRLSQAALAADAICRLPDRFHKELQTMAAGDRQTKLSQNNFFLFRLFRWRAVDKPASRNNGRS